MNFLKFIFGGGRNVITETVSAFRPNAEAVSARQSDYDQAALAQYAAEYQHARTGFFDRFMDGLNRLPRPLMVMAVFLLFSMAMINPIWFAERMQGLALVPDPLWWLAATIVTFYFGGRFQIKSQEFQKQVMTATAQLPKVLGNIKQIRALRHDTPGVANPGTDAALDDYAIAPHDNPAVADWMEEATS